MKRLSFAVVVVLTAFALDCVKMGAEAQLNSAITLFEQRLTGMLEDVGVTGTVNALVFNDPVPVPTSQSLLLASQEDAYYYMQYAAIAYCHGSPLLTTWTCNYCKKLGSNTRLIAQLYNTTTQVAGFVNVDETREEIVVTFRGTWAVANVVLDLEIALVPFAGVNEGVQVHSGQLGGAQSIFDQLRTQLVTLSTEYPNYRLVFTGHSLGSNLATLTLLMTMNDAEFSGKTFTHFPYAGPRVGDHAFAQWVNAMDFTHARVVQFGDIVPHLWPSPTVYTHFGTEFWVDSLGGNNTRICERNVTEDPTCSNSLAPVYDILQHTQYFDINMLSCALEDPVNLLLQAVNVNQ